VLRELLGDYPFSDADSVGEALVILESSFEEVVAAHSPIALLLIEMILGEEWSS